MYSIKPGRGPSLMGGIGGIIAGVFGVIWIGVAISMGASGVFVLFGVVFVMVAIGGAIYNFYNAASRNRMSTMDITTQDEESDPIAEALGHTYEAKVQPADEKNDVRRIQGNFCPFCGAQAQQDFDFCPKCGKDI